MNFSNVLITGGDFAVTNLPSNQSAGLKLLSKNTAPSAIHNSAARKDPPKCHPHTREAILKKILDWVHDNEKASCFVWLYGPAGAGKTAIAGTIADKCHKLGFLAASFFFSRNALGQGRDDESRLVPTLVYQFVISIPEMRGRVLQVLEEDPLVLQKSLEAQVEELIVNPLNEVVEQGGLQLNGRPRLLILDGLDECKDAFGQAYILSTIFGAIKQLSIPLFCLVASRPEQVIRDTFNGDEMSAATVHIVLDDSYDPDRDIERFLGEKLLNIRRKHPAGSYLPQHWPSDNEILQLVQKSSGHFIYAATVVKFVESPRHQPMDRLRIIFGLSPPERDLPFTQLDALYTHILSSVADIERVLEILSMIMTVLGLRTTAYLEDLLGYRRGNIQILLCDLHSVIFVPPPEAGKEEVRFLHASLRDFLVDRVRSGPFFINMTEGYAKLALLYIRQIDRSVLDRDEVTEAILRGRFSKIYQKASVTQELSEAFSVQFLNRQMRWLTDHSNSRQDTQGKDFVIWLQLVQAKYPSGPLDTCLKNLSDDLLFYKSPKVLMQMIREVSQQNRHLPPSERTKLIQERIASFNKDHASSSYAGSSFFSGSQYVGRALRQLNHGFLSDEKDPSP